MYRVTYSQPHLYAYDHDTALGMLNSLSYLPSDAWREARKIAGSPIGQMALGVGGLALGHYLHKRPIRIRPEQMGKWQQRLARASNVVTPLVPAATGVYLLGRGIHRLAKEKD